MPRMRAALRIMCLQCVLLAVMAQAATVPTATPALIPHLARHTMAVAPVAVPGTQRPPLNPPQPVPREDLLFASPTTLDHIGRVVAAVSIDGKGPFRFIVDTGANHSTISPQLAALLGLKPSTRQLINVTGVTGTAAETSVFITKLQAGELTIADSRFPVIWASVMAGAEGILGAAGLGKDRLLVNFQHNQVIIARSRTEALPWGFSRMWATRLHGGLLSVPGRVGNVRVRAIIDTGSQRTLGNLALYRQLFAEEQGKSKYLTADVYGATHQVGIGKLQLAPTIDLGAIKISGVGLVFGDFSIFRVWGLTRRPTIILGMDVLGTVKAFAIDFRYAEIGIDTRYNYYESALTPPPQSGGPQPDAPYQGSAAVLRYPYRVVSALPYRLAAALVVPHGSDAVSRPALPSHEGEESADRRWWTPKPLKNCPH